jgi:uncharacterized SAM-binding protein YcdF (DUF218 family)
MAFFLSKLVPALLAPIGLACLLIAGSLIAQFRNRSRLAITLDAIALAILLVVGSPATARLLAYPLEMRDVPASPLPDAGAIVVLGGVTAPALPPQPIVHLTGGADRLTYAAELYTTHHAPLVVLSGGSMPWSKSLPPESAQMSAILQMLGVPPSAIIEEAASRNTHENAVYTTRLLLARGIRKILLVTSAMTMPRALAAFRFQGIDVIPAPTDFTPYPRPASEGWVSDLQADAFALVPSSDALNKSSAAIHEYEGLLLYRLAGWI